MHFKVLARTSGIQINLRVEGVASPSNKGAEMRRISVTPDVAQNNSRPGGSAIEDSGESFVVSKEFAETAF